MNFGEFIAILPAKPAKAFATFKLLILRVFFCDAALHQEAPSNGGVIGIMRLPGDSGGRIVTSNNVERQGAPP